jgi:macrodomain Ter protein organizer (MatP/YcbG family)
MLKSAARKRIAPGGKRAERASAPRTLAKGRTRKVSLTVDEGVLLALQKEAKRSGRTLSAEVSYALDCELRRRRLQDLLTEYESEHGTITAEELAAVQAEWQD